MASLAQMERELILERTRAGLEAARGQGRVEGRKRRMTDGKVQATRKLLASGTPPHEVAHSLSVSIPTLYRWVPASSRTLWVAMGGGPFQSVNCRCRNGWQSRNAYADRSGFCRVLGFTQMDQRNVSRFRSIIAATDRPRA